VGARLVGSSRRGSRVGFIEREGGRGGFGWE
jgi:hypothetical protein